MALVRYCNKCKTEVPNEETCVHCGGKLTKTSEHISFGYVGMSYKDFFAYNEILRVILSALLIVFLFSVVGEGIASGFLGIEILLTDGFVSILLGIFFFCILILFLLFCLRGAQRIHCVLNKEGIHVYTYVPSPTSLQLLLHFVSTQQLQKLANDPHQLEDLTLIRHDLVLWQQMRFVRIWQGGHALLVYRPRFWLATWAYFPIYEQEEIANYVKNKSKRHKGCMYTILE